ncbi:MAG: acyl-CoA desaturase [Myxococcota bacterium]
MTELSQPGDGSPPIDAIASGPNHEEPNLSPSSPISSPDQDPTAAARVHGVWQRHTVLSAALYWTIHAACLLAFVTGVGRFEITLCLALFWIRLFGITGGYHRYFSHRAYKTSRAFQLVLAVLGCAATQKGPLWWAAHHRRHHAYSDQPGDVHSPREGFWHAHQGWIFDGRADRTDVARVPDLVAFPELVWLDRWHVVVPLALAGACFAAGGLGGLVWGFCISTTLLWHATYTINSLSHRFGSQRYATGDDSRNNFWLALLTIGEGWHNNHHHYMASARQGFFWWEIDPTYYVLRALAAVGIVWDLREPPARLLQPDAEAQPVSRAAA